jgi:DNA primase
LKISEDTINEIKSRAHIVDVIGEYVHLKQAGNNYKGLCPFHAEKTPSFMVSPSKGIFHCFGCGAGGNVFTFLMKFKGITFPEAVRALGEKVGIRVSDTSLDSGAGKKIESIYRVNKETARLFEKNLDTRSGEAAREYLRNRKIDAETLRSYQIGYAPDSWDALLTYFGKKGYGSDLLEEAGLVVKRKQGTGYYDRFRNRIMFPIQDSMERVIGFGGRTFSPSDTDTPKYINSNENLVYHKGKNLYGFNIASEHIRKSGFAFIVEGYMDVLRMFKEGFRNTVAPLGTALTEDQISLIMRYTRKIFLCFDPDEAGKKAMIRAIHLMHSKGIDPSIILLPSGRDPGDFFDEYTKEDFQLFLDGAEPGIHFIINSFVDRKKSYTANEKIVILQGVSEYYLGIKDAILQNEFLKILSSALGISDILIRQEFSALSHQRLSGESKGRTVSTLDTATKRKSSVSAEQYLLLLLLSNPELLSIAESRLDESYFRGKWTRQLWGAIIKANAHGSWNSGTVFDYLNNEKYIEYLSGKLIEENLNMNPEEQIIDVVATLKEKKIREKIEKINGQLRDAELENDDERAKSLIIEKQAYRNELEKIKILRTSKFHS